MVELVAGQFTLETALADLSNADAPVRDALRNQLGLIAGLRQQIGTASGNALAMLRAEVTAIAGNAAATAQAARANASADSSQNASIGTLASAAREQTATVMAGMKDFDRDLKFASKADEDAYRQREAERVAFIAAEQAKHTPQGDLNAAGTAIGQMADAGAHGAADNPAFQQRWDALIDSTAKLRTQLIRDGKDVTEFDAHLREDLRRILKSKGLSDAQIDAQFAAHPDSPLEAAKAFVAEHKGVISEKEITDLSRRAQEDRDSIRTPPTTVSSPDPASPMVDAMAKFKACGITLADHDGSAAPEHGIAGQGLSAQSQSLGRHS